jgi:predicted secreted acid phosphatase
LNGLRAAFEEEIRKNSEKITMDVIVIYQADQEIAALDLQKFN